MFLEKSFELVSSFEPKGDQPKAIEELTQGIRRGDKYQTLLGVTGSGKTFTVANVIQQINRPTLVISHNKTLAAQLYGEFKGFFPNNAVEYFISYYDYYQPEAYIPQTDTFIEKDTSINEEIEKLRLRATSSLLTRKDVIIVASVSCIYGLGSPDVYKNMMVFLTRGGKIGQEKVLERLIDIQYTRNNVSLERGTFRVRGDVIEIFPAYEEHVIRVELFGDEIEHISIVHPLTGDIVREVEYFYVYPARHFVTTQPDLQNAIVKIREELEEQLIALREKQKLLEAQRIEMRTNFDLEMMEEVGYCSGIENYSRHLSDRSAGERPYCLIDYFPDDFLTIIDESHVTVGQVRGMYNGDRTRKTTLVDYGFRLPSALDNRPMTFEEFEDALNQVIFVSATPGDYESEKSEGVFVEQIIRPTGLVDPDIEIRPVTGQIDDLIGEIRRVVGNQQRVLVTTLTKRMAEDLTEYLAGLKIRVRYLHSEIDALDRVQIIRDLRLAEYDVLVGINLLREGLDLPEVGLVAILDADKEGFLRSETSLIQTAGRAARNKAGKVLLYADNVTGSMERAIAESDRRRQKQLAYNEQMGIVPESIYKSKDEVMLTSSVADVTGTQSVVKEPAHPEYMSKLEREDVIEQLTREMKKAAKAMEFEKAAALRDEIQRVKETV